MRRLHFAERLQLAHAGSTEYKSMSSIVLGQRQQNSVDPYELSVFEEQQGLHAQPIVDAGIHYRLVKSYRNRNRIVIVISKLLKRYSKAKRTRAPAYSRALRRIKGGFQRGSREAQVRIPEYQEGTE